MNPTLTKIIAFDLFGVIVTEAHLISNALMHLLPPDIKKHRVKSAYEEFNLGKITEAEFWHSLGLLDYRQLRTKLLNCLELDTDLYPVIKQLKTHHQLAILSNCPVIWAEALSSKFEFEKHFNPIIFSGHVACKKPQPEIYQMLLAKTRHPPDQIVFIDDRLQNLQAAHEQGYKTIHMKRDQETHVYIPDYQISSLIELLEIF